jgi:hypothetical protein
MRRFLVILAVLFLNAGLFAAAQTSSDETTAAPATTAKKSTTAKTYAHSTYKSHKAGGFMGFLVGCCLGPRVAGEYNEGKKIHWREWVHLVASPWAAYEGYKGKTHSDYVNQYGSEFF